MRAGGFPRAQGGVGVELLTVEDDLAALLLRSSLEELEAPAGTASALVSFVVETGVATAFDVFYDVLFFGESGLLFGDGFESGDVSAWSNSSP